MTIYLKLGEKLVLGVKSIKDFENAIIFGIKAGIKKLETGERRKCNFNFFTIVFIATLKTYNAVLKVFFGSKHTLPFYWK